MELQPDLLDIVDPEVNSSVIHWVASFAKDDRDPKKFLSDMVKEYEENGFSQKVNEIIEQNETKDASIGIAIDRLKKIVRPPR